MSRKASGFRQTVLGVSVSLFASLGISGLISACSPESPKLVTPPVHKTEAVHDTTNQVYFNPAVDILFVVDNSASMDPYQQGLSANINQFISGISNNQLLDYHMGVITSTADGFGNDPGTNGILVGQPNWIDRTTPNGLDVLRRNLLVGIDGSGTEMFFRPVELALSSPVVNGLNAGFYRPDASLAVIFITDTDDQSFNITTQQFQQFMLNLKLGDQSKIIAYNVIIPSVGATCQRDGGETNPAKLEEFNKINNGQTFSLCSPDYGAQLAKLSIDLVSKVAKTIYLSRVPYPDTIRVTFGSQTIPSDRVKGWTYDASKNALVFGDGVDFTKQPKGTQVQVDFTAAEFSQSP